jgi:hypothetical protein
MTVSSLRLIFHLLPDIFCKHNNYHKIRIEIKVRKYSVMIASTLKKLQKLGFKPKYNLLSSLENIVEHDEH